MTWYELFHRIGKQPIRITKYKDVTVKIDDMEYKCKPVYTDSGNNLHLEIDNKGEKDYDLH